jgi:hypothetical protein
MSETARKVLRWTLRVALAGIYLFAAIPKILDPWAFAHAIHNFRILPAWWIPPLATTLPTLEAVAALAVLTGIFYRGGVLCVTLLSLVFAAGIGLAIARGLNIDCGCFGGVAHSSAGLPHLALNVGSAAAGIILLAWSRRPRKRRRLPRGSRRRRRPDA